MDKTLVTITYKTASGSRICVEVSTPVKELLDFSDFMFTALTHGKEDTQVADDDKKNKKVGLGFLGRN